mmetsp:Transcript_10793/g.19690  ORF Transcript_10793/g.19690 Transcript_10793/m.19690 type:complete len:81 (+) Transcript_10793:3382-3624(+)
MGDESGAKRGGDSVKEVSFRTLLGNGGVRIPFGEEGGGNADEALDKLDGSEDGALTSSVKRALRGAEMDGGMDGTEKEGT